MNSSDDETRYSLLPQVEKAWNFPLFEAIVGRRSRRFGFGMELSHGPFTYKSDKDPVPLDEAETAMLVAAATGVTGAILCEGEFQGGMVKSVGRPHPSAVGSHRTELFFTNDDGVFLFRGTQQQMTKMKEYETVQDRDKILGLLSQVHGQAIGQASRPAAQDAGTFPPQSLGHQQAGRDACSCRSPTSARI